MGQNQHGIIILNALPHIILPDFLSFRNGEFQLSLCIQNVHRCNVRPAVKFHGLQMCLCGIALTLVCGIAFHNGSFHMVNHRFHQIRSKEILISHLARMQLDSYFPGQFHPHGLIHSDHGFRRDLLRKINLCLSHTLPSFLSASSCPESVILPASNKVILPCLLPFEQSKSGFCMRNSCSYPERAQDSGYPGVIPIILKRQSRISSTHFYQKPFESISHVKRAFLTQTVLISESLQSHCFHGFLSIPPTTNDLLERILPLCKSLYNTLFAF